jgi:hypothetical protein
MPRSLTIQAIRQSQKEHGDDPFLLLLTIEIPGEPIYIVNNTENITSRGNEYIGCPFSIVLPDINDKEFSETSISIDNVDPRIWQGIRLLDEAPEITLELILASLPDEIVFSAVGLKLREASANPSAIVGKLLPDTVWQMGFPAHDFDPSQNQGMFST